MAKALSIIFTVMVAAVVLLVLGMILLTQTERISSVPSILDKETKRCETLGGECVVSECEAPIPMGECTDHYIGTSTSPSGRVVLYAGYVQKCCSKMGVG